MIVRVEKPARTLHIPNLLIQELVRAVRDVPQERCGLLLGPEWRIRHITNVSGTPECAYEMDTFETADALAELDEMPFSELEENVVVFHSHPFSRAIPSETDVEYAVFPRHLIIGRMDNRPEAAAFYVRDGEVEPMGICPHA